MEKIIRWFVNNNVAANMIMIFIIVAGALAIPFLRMEVFPEIKVDIINVSAIYPGASPEATEEAICIPIEERLQGIEGVKKISSVASQNLGTVNVEILPNQIISDMIDKVKAEVDAISNFPDDVEQPTIQQFTAVAEVITVAVSGYLDEFELTNLTDDIKDEINSLPEITYTQISGKKASEIKVEISKNTLNKYGLSLYQIAESIKNNSINIPSGSIKTDNGEIFIRSENQKYKAQEFGDIPIISTGEGAIIYLKDISKITDGYKDIDVELDFNGMPSKLIRVYRVGDQNAIQIADAIEEYIKQKNDLLPEGVQLTSWNNDARILKGRIALLIENAQYGFILVIIILGLFFKPKLALWVSLGIPISFMGGFWLMPLGDVSINMLSLFTFILVLGIVVDDAIVVGENIAHFREKGLSPKEAAIKGATQVSSPVIFAILTTIVTFSPMLAVGGTIGAIWRIIPLVTIFVLVWSLFESLTILPSHLAHSTDNPSRFLFVKTISNKWEKVQLRIKSFMDLCIKQYYLPVLNWVVNNIFSTIAISLSIFLLTVAMIIGGFMKFSFFPPIEGDIAIATIDYPIGTPIEITKEGFEILQNAANQLKNDLESEYPNQIIVTNTLSTLGYQPLKTKTSRGPGSLDVDFGGSNLGEITLELSPGEIRPIGTEEVVRRWRALTPEIPGVEDVSFYSSLFSAGDPVNIQLTSKNTDELLLAKDQLIESLKKYPGVFNVKDNYSSGKEEIKINLLPAATNYGIDMSMVGMQIRQAFYGLEVQSFQRGRDEVKVVLKYPKSERSSIADLEDLFIQTPTGKKIPMKQIANLEISDGVASIQRKNRKRAINVTSDVDLTITTGNNVISKLEKNVLSEIMSTYPTVKYSLEGEQQEQRQNLSSIGKNFIIAMIIVYTLLAILFKSYVQPVVVMSAIPFGLSGAVIGHLIMGKSFSILSLLGIVALTGVVVNDSLVIVDFINRYRKDGNSIIDSVLEAGPRRFRPIVLTSLTTFVSLIPLLLEKSVQAKFLIPMAISLAFGVLFATVITLILVPCLYLLIEEKFIQTFSKKLY